MRTNPQQIKWSNYHQGEGFNCFRSGSVFCWAGGGGYQFSFQIHLSLANTKKGLFPPPFSCLMIYCRHHSKAKQNQTDLLTVYSGWAPRSCLCLLSQLFISIPYHTSIYTYHTYNIGRYVMFDLVMDQQSASWPPESVVHYVKSRSRQEGGRGKGFQTLQNSFRAEDLQRHFLELRTMCD